MTEKNKGGRPTKYGPDALKKAEDYINNWKERGDAVPTVVGLALACEVATATVYNWVKDGNCCEKFLVIFTRIEQKQHQALVNNGLFGVFNPAVTKMMLTKHGYSDKVEQSHTSPDGSMTPQPTRIELVAPDVDPES